MVHQEKYTRIVPVEAQAYYGVEEAHGPVTLQVVDYKQELTR